MKKLLSASLIVITLIAVISLCTACYSPQNGGLLFAEVEGGYQVTGVAYWDRFYKNFTVNIPSHYNGKPVVAISDHAFQGYTSLISVSIPNTVKWIGSEAFLGCVLLTYVDIPDSVTHIGSEVFNGCIALTDVNISDSVTTIGYGAFANCHSLTSVTIPNSVTDISISAFNNCTSLTSVTVPKSVTSIGSHAFSYCDNLTRVYYSGSQAEWEKIVIGTENDPLKNASITFNSNNP